MRALPLTLRLGLFVLIAGSVPLLLFLAADAMGQVSDPNPNPVGLGLIFALGSMIASVLIPIGVVQLLLRRVVR